MNPENQTRNRPYEARLNTALETIRLRENLLGLRREFALPESVEELYHVIDVGKSDRSDVISIEVKWHSAEGASEIANRLAELFLKKTSQMEKVQTLELGLIDVQTRLQADLARISEIGNVVKTTPHEVELQHTIEFRKKRRLADLVDELAGLRERYTVDNPKVIAHLKQIVLLQSELDAQGDNAKLEPSAVTYGINPIYRELLVEKSNLEVGYYALQERAAYLQGLITKAELRPKQLAGIEKQYANLNREVFTKRGSQQIIEDKLAAAWIAMSSDVSNYEVIEKAEAPLKHEASWRKLITAAGAFFGLAGSAGCFLLMEILDFRVKTARDCESNLGLIPLGKILDKQQQDRSLLQAFLSVALVAPYQIVSRLSETFRQFATQFHDALGPVAATLFSSGDTNNLKKILLDSNRLVAAISTLLFVPLVFLVKPLLKLWLKLEDPVAITCGVILLISMYILVTLRSSTVHILLMYKKEKVLTVVAIAESFMNLVLSIFLCRFVGLGIIGVALGTLAPNLLFAVLFNIPIGCRFAETKPQDYIRQTLSGSLAAGALAWAVLIVADRLIGSEGLFTLLFLLFLGSGSFAMFFLFVGITGEERRQILGFLKKRLEHIQGMNLGLS